MLTALLAGLHQYVFSTFQQDSCTLTATWELTLGGFYAGNPPPTISYSIANSQGGTVDQGSGTLGAASDSPAYPPTPAPADPYENFSDQSQAQTVQTAACWYSPYELPTVIWSPPNESYVWVLWVSWFLVAAWISISAYRNYPWRLGRVLFMVGMLALMTLSALYFF
jgi:hypothetical protein